MKADHFAAELMRREVFVGKIVRQKDGTLKFIKARAKKAVKK